MNTRTTQILYGSIGLAFGLWLVMFVFRPFNFWLMMSVSTITLSLITLIWGRPFMDEGDFSLKNVLLGLLSAAFLYGFFWMGNHILIFLHELLPAFIPNRADNINSVYANRGAISPIIVGMLLFFPIGFGEEFFWRGFVQRQFGKRMKGLTALLVTTGIYTAVHIPTLNPVLILAALTCGLFWGGLYWWRKSLTLVLVSHMVWDPFIFVVWPIH